MTTNPDNPERFSRRPRAIPPFGSQGDGCIVSSPAQEPTNLVITSYSIHYTKLYEEFQASSMRSSVRANVVS